MASSSSIDPRIKALIGGRDGKKPLVTHRPPVKPPRTASGSWKKAPKRG
jgi:hypothetical protein